MGRLKRFGQELGKVISNIGKASEKVLDNPKLRKLDDDLKKIAGDY